MSRNTPMHMHPSPWPQPRPRSPHPNPTGRPRTQHLLLAIIFCLPLPGIAQEKGVHFEQDLSWTAIRAKAKAEHKYIFMDCFTTWCGPCRYMSKTIFTQEESGNFLNDKFVNVQVQLDTTIADSPRITSWYADAHALMTKYEIRAFPTFLVFSPDGQVLHRMVGSVTTAKEFITRTQESFDTTKQYYTQLQEFRDGRRDTAFLRRLAMQCLDVYDMTSGRQAAKAYFATRSSLYNPGALDLLDGYTQTSQDEGFAVFVHHAAEVDKIAGPGKAEKKVIDVLVKEYIYPTLHDTTAAGPDWKSLQASIATRFPRQAAEVTARGKVIYYQEKTDWPHFQTAIVALMKQYGSHASPEELNDYAWAVFRHCPDMTCVSDALDWSRRSFKDQPNPMFMDTYANILYKMGKKTDAIAWEEKALQLADEGSKSGYRDTIDKMKKGEKTWE